MSTRYIHFTDEQKAQARQTDIVSLLKLQGETLKRSGKEWEWKNGSQKVTVRGNLWFHQYERVGGDAIDFVRRFYNKSYPEAVEYLLGNSGGTIRTSPPVVKEVKPFELPPKNENNSRVKAYLLHTRGIDEDVYQAFEDKGMIYESADYHNAVFVGLDKDGIPRHAHKRGSGSQSTYKGNAPNSQPEYSFHWQAELPQRLSAVPDLRTEIQSEHSNVRPHQNLSGKLYLFEAPIDMLSFISMQKADDLQKVLMREKELKHIKMFGRELAAAACRWKENSYAASCSVSDKVLFQCLKDNPCIEKVYICFDSDEPGQTAANKISTKLFALGIESEILVPKLKDWNEDLQSAVNNAPHKSADFFLPDKIDEKGVEKQCQALSL